jgi:hypothetical protein
MILHNKMSAREHLMRGVKCMVGFDLLPNNGVVCLKSANDGQLNILS